jgi:hypothetical protein
MSGGMAGALVRQHERDSLEFPGSTQRAFNCHAPLDVPP